MFRNHIFSFALSSLALLASTLAPAAAHARYQQPAGMPEPETVLGEGALEPETRVISEGEITRMAVLSVTHDELVMEWETATGCTFELAFYPHDDLEVVAGEIGRCNFESWFVGATEPIDPELVVSVWENPSWWDVISNLPAAGTSSPPNPDDFDVPDAESHTEIEEASECGKAIAWFAFSSIGCTASVGVALGATGGTMGAFAWSFAFVVAACGAAGVHAIDVMDNCEDHPSFNESGVEDLLDYIETMEHASIPDYTEVEEAFEQYTEIEDLGYDFTIESDVEELVDIGAAFIEGFGMESIR